MNEWLGVILSVVFFVLSVARAENGKESELPIQRMVKKLTCSPSKVNADGSVTIKMPVPHGGDLGIEGPDGIFYSIINSGPKSILKRDEFEKMAIFNLKVSGAKGLSFSSGKIGPIFEKQGQYNIQMSENLETNDETVPVFECAVQYSLGK